MLKKIILKVWFQVHYFISFLWLLKIKTNKNLYDLMKYFQKKSNSTGVGYGDIWFLYTQIKKRRPKNILEFSTGASTAFMALAIKELQEKDSNYKPNFYSLENHQGWIEHQKEIFPKELVNIVKIVKSDISKVNIVEGVDMVVYNNMPELDYDFMHVDGPNEDFGTQVVKNVIDILNKSNNDEIFMVFDNRMIPTKETIKAVDNTKYKWDRSLITWLVGNNLIRKR